MTPEQAAVFISIVGIVGTAFNVWLTVKIKSEILGLKLWVTQNFVAKEDMQSYLSPYGFLKEAVQLQRSDRHNTERGHAG